MLRQRKVPVLERHLVLILGEQPRVQHVPERRAVRTLQVLVDHHVHGTLGIAFHGNALPWQQRRQGKKHTNYRFHRLIGCCSVKLNRVSAGIFTFWPLVITCAPAPTAAPDTAPIAAPLPPPAIAPMIAPSAVPPPTVSAERFPRD